jgi:hypothetical protein
MQTPRAESGRRADAAAGQGDSRGGSGAVVAWFAQRAQLYNIRK